MTRRRIGGGAWSAPLLLALALAGALLATPAAPAAGNTSTVSFPVKVLAATLPATGTTPGPAILVALLLLGTGMLLLLPDRRGILG